MAITTDRLDKTAMGVKWITIVTHGIHSIEAAVDTTRMSMANVLQVVIEATSINSSNRSPIISFIWAISSQPVIAMVCNKANSSSYPFSSSNLK